MTTAFIFFSTLTILVLVLYRLERNRPGEFLTTRLHGGSRVEDRDLGRSEVEMQAITAHRQSLLSRWVSPSRNVALAGRPWHLS